MDTTPSIARRLQERWTRLAERLFGDAAGTENETARGEFTSAFMSERNLADYVARENARRNAHPEAYGVIPRSSVATGRGPSSLDRRTTRR